MISEEFIKVLEDSTYILGIKMTEDGEIHSLAGGKRFTSGENQGTNLMRSLADIKELLLQILVKISVEQALGDTGDSSVEDLLKSLNIDLPDN